MTRAALERHQVWIYLAAIAAGLGLGVALGERAAVFEVTLWPVLGLLLFTTFTQVPLVHLAEGFRDRRFMAAILSGNFLIIPVLVWGLIWFLPDDPAVRLGVLMVLLVPCTDWFITFTHLAGGDTGRAIAVTPVNLLVQLALLPVFLWLFMGRSFLEIFAAGPIAMVFLTLILLPLAGAWVLERWSQRSPGRATAIAALGWAPVPLLAVVVFLIATSQVQTVLAALPVLGAVTGVFVAFLVLSVAFGLWLGARWRFDEPAIRALALSFGTRNSFVVLPLSLSLASEWQTATVVIVFQSVVELIGVLVLLWVLPRRKGRKT
ncbi:MAG: arsenic resistance protein, partial [Paracoccaceae bacterium]